MQGNNDKSSIDKLRQNLYSRNQSNEASSKKTAAKPIDETTNSDWQALRENKKPNTGNKKMSLLKLIFIFSLIFFIASAGLALYIFYGGGNVVTPENIDIEIEGPISVEGGELLEFEVVVTNKNNAPLEESKIQLSFPEGTRMAGAVSRELSRQTLELGTINPGDTKKDLVTAIIFGEENSQKTINITLEYRISGSSGIFSKDYVYDLILSSAPIVLSVDAFSEVNSGREVDFKVNVGSNTEKRISDLILKIDYPNNFEFTGSEVDPAKGDNIWRLGNLEPGEKKELEFKGIVRGDDGEERSFKFELGVASENNRNSFDTPLISSFYSVFVRKPFIGTTLAIEGNRDERDYITSSERVLRADIEWSSNLDTDIKDAEIQVELNGEILDKQSVIAEKGFYNSSTNTIIWNKNRDSSLGTVSPGDSGRVSFTFSPRGDLPGILSINNPEIAISLNIKGRRVSDSQVPEEVFATVRRNVKVVSNINMTSRVVYSVGPFQNIGPMPPVAERETTYTVILRATNTVNTVRDAKVNLTLPSYVRFINEVDPVNERVTYNPVGGVVTWDLATLSKGTGHGEGVREVAFKIALLPSISQVGLAPVLANGVHITGVDNFTGSTLTNNSGNLNTRISTDPIFNIGFEKVNQQ